MRATFRKKKEDFICERCGFAHKGDGYTNHCQKCLTSKHVDVFPGDRKETCGGMMRPVSFEKQGEEYMLVHRCLLCGVKKKCKLDRKDNIEQLILLSHG